MTAARYPETTQDRRKAAQDRPKISQERPKASPRWPDKTSPKSINAISRTNHKIQANNKTMWSLEPSPTSSKPELHQFKTRKGRPRSSKSSSTFRTSKFVPHLAVSVFSEICMTSEIGQGHRGRLGEARNPRNSQKMQKTSKIAFL